MPRAREAVARAVDPIAFRQPFLSAPFDRSVSLLAWGYNEEAGVEAFLRRAIRLMEDCVADFEIVFINDGSSDRTGERAEAIAAQDPRLRVFHNPRNMNVGYSCRRAVRAATKEYLFWQTVDWSYDLRNLRAYLELLKHYDVVQGVRQTVSGGAGVFKLIATMGRRSDNRRKAVVSIVNYLLVRALFGVPLSDYQNVTFYRTGPLQRLPLEGNSSFLNPEMLIRSYAAGLRFIEVPIPFLRRGEGNGKGTRLRAIARSLREIFSAWCRWGWRLRAAGGGRRGHIHRASERRLLAAEVRAILDAAG